MYPILFETGWLTVYSFGTLLAIAFIAGIYVTRLEMTKRGLDPDLAYDLVLGVAVCALIGARLFYVAGHWSDFYAANPGEIMRIWNGGLVFYGGLLGGALGLFGVAKYRKLNVMRVADCVAAPLALGSAIGRIGCFLNGCCYGIAAKAPLGLHFPGNGYEGTYYPTQLVEMVWGFAMFGVIYFWLEKKVDFKTDGSVFLIYLTLYGFGRFFVEFARFATWRLFGIFTFSQLISAVIFAGGLYMIIQRRRADTL